jgi:DHA1 family bicyclomycin/chloramphenicol resistance-like MFS transporter
LGTTLPLFVGFMVCGSISLGIFILMRRRAILAAA